MYETFDHTADVGIRIQAADLEALFGDAGRALFSLLVTNPHDVRCVVERSFQLEADQLDYLLFDWLTELLYVFESESLLLAEFQVHIFDQHRVPNSVPGVERQRAPGPLTCGDASQHHRHSLLQATCRGERIDRTRHQLDHEVKAITYHQLRVEQRPEGWLAEVIVDI
jgi:SHS2 domain-containing protein